MMCRCHGSVHFVLVFDAHFSTEAQNEGLLTGGEEANSSTDKQEKKPEVGIYAPYNSAHIVLFSVAHLHNL